MKILIVGLGSIGRKHLEAIRFHNDIEIASLRTRKGTLTDTSGIQEYSTIEDALNFNPDGVIISNPTSLHVHSALPFLQKGIKVLIEKPISETAEGAQLLKPYSHLILVAYCLRFSPLSQYFKENNVFQTCFKLGFKRSYYLPKWHPYADYRKEYTAKKCLGGGVIRTLSHEIDLAIHWLGIPLKTSGIVDKLSHLELDGVDDFAVIDMKMNNGARVHIELDFYSPININGGELYTSKGKYSWDLKALSFCSFENSINEVVLNLENAYSNIYKDQITDFISFIQSGKSENCTFFEGATITELIDNIDSNSSN